MMTAAIEYAGPDADPRFVGWLARVDKCCEAKAGCTASGR
jgi:hypothetical protein